MKSILLLALICIFFLSCKPRGIRSHSTSYAKASGNLVQNLNEFGLTLYKAESKQIPYNKNFLISPASVSAALSMTYVGARGDTLDEFVNTMGLHPNYKAGAFKAADWLRAISSERIYKGKQKRWGKEIDVWEGYQLSVSNGLYLQKDYPFDRSFARILNDEKQGFNATVAEANFQNNAEAERIKINQVVSEDTKEKIKELIPANGIDTSTITVITNAIYFEAEWLKKFELLEKSSPRYPKLHFPEVPNEDILMMQKVQNCKYGHKGKEGFDIPLSAEVVQLPYKGLQNKQTSMVLILPQESLSLEAFEKQLTLEALNQTIKSLIAGDVSLTMPKFNTKFNTELSTTLHNRLGFKTLFSSAAANLQGISKQPGIHVSKVFHSTSIDVFETGTIAAAATAVAVSKGLSLPMAEMILNRPFFFLIWDDINETILFMGRIAKPTWTEKK